MSRSAVDRWAAALGREGPLLVGDGELRYAEAVARADRYSATLRSGGMTRGDRVAVVADPHPDVVVALIGHLRAGLVHLPINTRYLVDEVRHILEDARPRLALVDAAHAEVVREAAPDLPTQIIGGTAEAPLGAEGPDAEGPEGPTADRDPALMIYTSGTTAKSKGVVLSYDALVGNMDALTTLWGWRPDDRLVLALPLFHVHGLCIGVVGSLLRGVAIDLQPGFTSEGVVRGIAGGGTIFMGVPTMYRRIVDHLDAHPAAAADLRRGRLFTSGSAPLSPDVFTRFERHTGHQIVERYGMSETLITLSNRVETARRPGVVGLPVPGVEARVVDDDGRPVADGQLGELHVRGVGLLTEYWQRPDETAKAFDSQGWFRTGDVVKTDPDGLYRIMGRKSVDMIKTGGFRVSAREIEEVLQDHPAVGDVAVVGLPDPEWGQIIAAAIIVAPDADPAGIEAALVDWTAERLAGFKKPRRIVLVDELPKNALGKVQKPRLIEAMSRPEPPA